MVTPLSIISSNTLSGQEEKIEIDDEIIDTKYSKANIQKELPKRSGIFMFIVRHDIPYLLVACLIMCISSIGTPLQTIVYGKIFGKLSDYYKQKYSGLDTFMSDIRLLCGFIMLIGFGKMVATWAGIFVWMKFGEKQSTRARVKVFQSLLNKDIEWFDDSKNLMGEVSQINRCIEELRCGTSEVIGLLVQTVASIIALFVSAMIHSWSLTLVIMASAPIMALLGFVFGRLTYQAAELENDLTAKASKVLDWSFVSCIEVRIFNGKYYEMIKFNRMVDLSAKAYFKLANAIAGNIGVLKCLTLLMFVQGFWFGNHMIEIGKLRIDEVFTCFTSCLMLGSEISEISMLLATMNKAQAAANKIASIIQDSIAPIDTGIYPKTCDGYIEFDNVNFEYSSRPGSIIQNINVSFRANELNFIIGESGSGKSTLSQLILNFYKPTDGSIRIDGLNVSTLSHKWITDNITLLSQNPILFNDTLKGNIGIAAINKFASFNDIPESLILNACNFALLEDMIDDLSNGIDTNITSNMLSGGQQQRVAIARAKISDTPILILDEVFSALDNNTKGILFHKVKEWRKGKTTIIITHEFSQIEADDYVVLMKGGQIKNKGYMCELSEEELILKDKSSKVNESYDIAKFDDSYIEMPKDEGTFIYHYLRNPVILKDLENSKAMMDNTARPQDVLSVVSILNHCRKTIDKKKLIVLGLVFSILGGVSSPVFSFCFSKILVNMVNTSLGQNVGKELIKWSCTVIGISIVCGLTHYLSSFILSFASENWIVNLRKSVFEKLNEQELAYFGLEATKPAELTALLMNDTRDLRNLVSEFVSIVINLITMLLVGIIWSLITGWKLALVGISFVPLILLITYTYSLILGVSENRYKTKIAILENFNHETIMGMKLIRSLDLKKHFMHEFHKKINEVNRVGFVRAICTGFGISLSDLSTSLATGTILYYGMELVGKKEYTQSQLIQVITILSFSMTNAAGLLTQMPDIARGQRAGTYIINLLKLKPSSIENDGYVKPFVLTEKKLICFRNVNFQYPNSGHLNDMTLKNISFNINRNEIVGIVGESGSGKSTIASLITRLYGINDGSIFIANYDLYNIDIDWLRDSIAVVTQIPTFFEGSIYENLIYGMETNKISTAKVGHCLKMANIYPFILSLPEGIHTKLGEGQNSLISGGQLQRLSIARALIRNPKILIMDECTSSLDPDNTNIIIDLIRNNLSDRDFTVILITHNKEMMKIADRLIVIKEGSVNEQGDFDSLYQKGHELYRITNGPV